MGDLLLVEAEERDGHQGDHDGAETEAADGEPENEQPVVRMRSGEGEGDGRGGHEGEAGDGDRAGADLVGEPPGQAAGEQGTHALRDEHDPGRQRGGAAYLLVVEGQQQHRSVQGEPGKEQDRGRRGDRPAGEQPHVDERLSAPSGPVPDGQALPGRPQCVAGEGGGERDTDRQRDDDTGMREAGVAARVAQPEDDRGDPGREQGEARQVKARPGRHRVRLVGGQVARGEDEPGDAERHVHPEHEPPAEVGEDRAADERAEYGAEQRGQRDDGDGPA